MRFDTTIEYVYFDVPQNQTNWDGERHIQHSGEKPDFCYIEYLDRHQTFPISNCTEMHFYYDRVEIGNPQLVVPYRHMRDIENASEEKLFALRVIVAGLIFVPLAILDALCE